MEIVNVTEDIASRVSHIYAQSWKHTYKDIIPQQFLDELSNERWTPLLQDSSYKGYVLKDKEELIATSSISSARDEAMEGWGEIVSIYVLPGYLHKGYGKILLHHVIEQLQSYGFDKFYLWVLKDNVCARSFYERNGFVTNGDMAIANIGGKELEEIRYVYHCID